MVTNDTYLDVPPPPAQRVDNLYVWIATHEDASEGVISADLPLPKGLGIRHMPLVSSNRSTAVKLRDLAEKAAGLAKNQAGHKVTVQLVRFKRVIAD